ncbi:MAG: substrate-binding domain-containing protein [Flavobacteriaceae bacterium]|jgi:phosphate transport system substrate-binding protein|nr:substrate-binding domain-containing protein [Flavobacteriaceae bacterium]
MKLKYILLLSAFFLLNCKKDKKAKTETYYQGNMTILTDDSFKSVTEALADGYMINYPEAKLNVETKKEDLAFLDLLSGKSKIIVMSRELSEPEIEEYNKQIKSKFIPAKFAADAVVFIVPKNSPKESISMEEIKAGLNSDEKPFIFDGANSGNLNFVAQKIGQKPADLKFSVIPGNENVIRELDKYPDKIGVIGLNTISRPYDKKSEELRNIVKILPVEELGTTYEISYENLRSMKYPFTRVLYFVANEGGFNLASGFIRFSCTQIGQKIVQKEGLQPYNIYKREVQMR